MTRKHYPFAHAFWIYEAAVEHAFNIVIDAEDEITAPFLYEHLNPASEIVYVEALVHFHMWIHLPHHAYAFTFSDDKDALDTKFAVFKEDPPKPITAHACLIRSDFSCSTIARETILPH